MSKINFQNVHTMIGADARIDGPVCLNEGIIIYGKINGDIETKGPVRVAQNAVVDGNISGSDIRVGGTDIVYRKLLIEDGAQFEGKCDIAIGEDDDSGSPS